MGRHWFKVELDNEGQLKFKHTVDSQWDGETKFENYVLSGKFPHKSLAVLAAVEYVKVDYGEDFISKNIVWNKEEKNRPRRPLLALIEWYFDYLLDKDCILSPSAITIVPSKDKTNQLQYLMNHIINLHDFEEFHPMEKLENVSIDDWQGPGPLYTVDSEKIKAIKAKFDYLIIIDDVITKGRTVNQCVDAIRNISDLPIFWISLSATFGGDAII